MKTTNNMNNESNNFVGKFSIITAGKHKNMLGYIEMQSEALGCSVGIVGSHENMRFETLVPHGEFLIIDQGHDAFDTALHSALLFYEQDRRSKLDYIATNSASMSEADKVRLCNIIVKRVGILTELKIDFCGYGADGSYGR